MILNPKRHGVFFLCAHSACSIISYTGIPVNQTIRHRTADPSMIRASDGLRRLQEICVGGEGVQRVRSVSQMASEGQHKLTSTISESIARNMYVAQPNKHPEGRNTTRARCSFPFRIEEGFSIQRQAGTKSLSSTLRSDVVQSRRLSRAMHILIPNQHYFLPQSIHQPYYQKERLRK